MKREREATTTAGEECENKVTHWFTDLVQCIVEACFPRLRLESHEDATRLLTLQLVSHQFESVVRQWLAPRLRRCHAAIFTAMTPLWQARLTGLRRIDARHLPSLVDFSPYTELRRLSVAHFTSGNNRLQLPYGLCKLALSCTGPRRIISLGTGLSCLRRLTVDDGSRFVTLACLAGLTTLHTLILKKARVAHPVDLVALPSLRSLSLAGNRELGDRDLAALTQLHKLDLSRNSCITDAGLSGLTGLRKLNLTRNDRIDDDALYGMTRLHTLVLNDNVTIGCAPLLRMPCLTSLHCSGCITIVPREFSRLTQLTELDLSQAMKPLQQLDWLSHLSQLRSLSLFTREVVTSTWLHGMPHLVRLSLAPHTPITNRARQLLMRRGGVCLYRVKDGRERAVQ